MSALIAITASSDLRIGNSAPRRARASSTTSVGMFPTRSSCAKGHPPKSAYGGLEAAAAGIIGGQNLLHGIFAAAVQVGSQIRAMRSWPSPFRSAPPTCSRRSQPDRIGQRHRANIHVGHHADRLQHLAGAPRIAVGIAERHRDVRHHVEPGGEGRSRRSSPAARSSPPASGSGSASGKSRRASRESPRCARLRWRWPAPRLFR